MANKLSSENSASFDAVDRSGQEMTFTPPKRVIGRDDNHPPSLVALLLDQLDEVYGKEWAKVEPIRAKANALEQKIETDEQLAAWTAIYTEARTLYQAKTTLLAD